MADVQLHGGWRLTLPTGIVLGRSDADGVVWTLEDLKGWDTPASTGSVTQRAYQSGGWADRAFLAPRVLVATGAVIAPTDTALGAASDLLAAAIPLDELEAFTVSEPGRERYVLARQDGDPIVTVVHPTAMRYSIQFIAPDPRRLQAGAVRTLTTGLPSSVGGLAVPFAVPFSIAATTVTGVLSVVNAGTAPALAIVRIDGPAQRPVIRHEEQGLELTFDLILDAGQWLEVDLDKHTVMLNGQASRRGLMRGRWPVITPGINTISWSSLTASPSAAMTVSWRDAWK